MNNTKKNAKLYFVMEHPDSMQYYTLHKTLLKSIFQWPRQNKRLRRFIVNLETVMTILFTTAVILKIKTSDNKDVIFDCLTTAAITITAVLNQHTILYMKVKFHQMLTWMYEDWDNIYFESEDKIFRKWARYANLTVHFITGYIFISAIIFLSGPIATIFLNIVKPLNETRIITPIVEIEVFVNPQDYEIPIMLYSYIIVVICLTNVTCYDVCYATFLLHNCALFEISGYNFEQVLYNSETKSLRKLKEGERTIKAIWHRSMAFHRKALDFNQTIESIFTWPCAIELLICTIQSSVCMIHVLILIKRQEWYEVLRYGTFIFGQFIRLFTNILPGQLLINSSNNFFNKVYNGNWYVLPLNYQKMVTLVLLKSKTTAFVTASKLFILGFEIFAIWVKTVVTYFTIMLSLRD